jgi:hypothetical protein
MTRFLALSWGIVTLLSGSSALGAQAQTTAPAAVVSKPSHQFEPVLEGQVVTHDFVVHNKGSADLQIEKIKTG